MLRDGSAWQMHLSVHAIALFSPGTLSGAEKYLLVGSCYELSSLKLDIMPASELVKGCKMFTIATMQRGLAIQPPL